jgi:sugar lactone lactonase YvrE
MPVTGRRISAAVALALPLSALACSAILGIEDRVLVGVDAGVEADAAPDVAIADAADAADAPACADPSLTPCGAAGCVDTTKTRDHCGACFHSCEGADCTRGFCQGITIASGLDTPLDVAVDDTTVYFITSVAAGAVYALPKDAGPDAAPTRIASNQSNPDVILVDHDAVYVLNSGDTGTNGNVVRIPKDGGGAPPTVLASKLTVPQGLALSADSVFFPSDLSTVSRVAKTGGPVTQVTNQANVPLGMATDSDYVYWVNSGTGGGPGQLQKYPLVGDGGANGIVLDSQENPNAWAVAVDGTSVYWTDFGPFGSGAVYRASKIDGSGFITLARNQSKADRIVADSKYVYWTSLDDGTVSRSTLDGRPPGAQTMVTGLVAPSGIAIDATSLYVTTAQGGTVLRIVK